MAELCATGCGQERSPGRKRMCRPCYMRAYRETTPRPLGYTRHGLTDESFDELMRTQSFACAICQQSITSKTATVDHDHECCSGTWSCGECVRGLLCRACNSGLGHLRDDLATVEAAARYLRHGLRHLMYVSRN